MVSRYPVVNLVWLIIAVMCTSLAVAQTASLEASVERQTVIDGESVLLYIKGVNLSQLPDTSALNRQFDIIDSRKSNQQVIEGGIRKTEYLMRFELLPKNLGQTEIPVFTADGQSTQAIRIDVVERGTPGAVPRDNVFAEVTLDKNESYVQGQVVMALHILDDGTLASVDPQLPDIPGVQVEPLSAGEQSIEDRNGEQYRMHTWRYALFPQRAGEIEIPRMQIPGSVRDPNYGGGLVMRSMATRRIAIRTPVATFQAKPKAAQSTADWWLPVKDLNVRQNWSDEISNSVVGEPLTLSFFLTTNGSTSNQIPEIKVPQVEGIKIYRDVPELESQPGNDGLTSQRREKWSVIPQRAGTLRIPPITVKWWNTETDSEQVVTLPEQVIVAALDPAAQQLLTAQADTTSGNVAAPVKHSLEPVTGNAEVVVLPDALPKGAALWKRLAVVALAGWFVTAVAWAYSGWRRRPGKDRTAGTEKELLVAVGVAGRKDDARAFRAALLKWAGSYWPDNAPVSPVEVAQRLNNEQLQKQMQEIESALYSPSAAPLSLLSVYSTLCESLSDHRKVERSQHSLPSL